MTPLEQMRALYAELPTIECKGLCANSCGPIDMNDVERARLVELGVDIPVFTQEAARRWAANQRVDDCPALGPMHQHPLMANVRMAKCTVYEDRPLICRLWGLSESMPCPNGCKPSRFLTDEEAYEFIFRSMEIGGHPNYGDAMRVKEIRALFGVFQDDPELGPLFARFIRGDRDAEETIVELLAARADTLAQQLIDAPAGRESDRDDRQRLKQQGRAEYRDRRR